MTDMIPTVVLGGVISVALRANGPEVTYIGASAPLGACSAMATRTIDHLGWFTRSNHVCALTTFP